MDRVPREVMTQQMSEHARAANEKARALTAKEAEARDNEDILTYLDDLRESGTTNMFGARPYLEAEFGMSKKEASAALSNWMETFGERNKS